MKRYRNFRRGAAALLTFGMLTQFGGCDFGQVTLTQTVDAQDVVVSTIRSFLLDPIDQFITDAVNNAFGNNDN